MVERAEGLGLSPVQGPRPWEGYISVDRLIPRHEVDGSHVELPVQDELNFHLVRHAALLKDL